MRSGYDARLAALEERLNALATTPVPAPAPEAAPAPQAEPAPPPQVAAATPAPLAVQGSTTANAKVFNPDIAVIGNFLGAAGKNPNSDQPHACVSTKSRRRSRRSWIPMRGPTSSSRPGRTGSRVEEGYITFTSLPGGTAAEGRQDARAVRQGQRAAHARRCPGRIGRWSRRTWWAATRACRTRGSRVSRPGQQSASCFSRRPARCIAARPTSSSAGAVGAGLRRPPARHIATSPRARTSTSAGRSRTGRPPMIPRCQIPGPTLDKRLVGVDATFRYRPLRRAIYRRFNGRAPSSSGASRAMAGDHRPDRVRALCAAATTSSRAAGTSAPATIDPSARSTHPPSTRRLVLLTFWPSEFSQIRGQYRRTQLRRGRHARTSSCSSSFLDRRARRPRFLGSEEPCIMRCTLVRILIAGRGTGGARATPALGAPLKVVTTTEDSASLAREVGGDKVIGRGHRPRLPGSALRRAQTQLHPQAVTRRSADRRRPRAGDRLAAAAAHAEPQREDPAGRPGYLDASVNVKILEIPTGQITRAMGDVHPQGNPHYWLDPSNGRVIAQAIAATLASCRRPTRRISSSATRTSTGGWRTARSAGTRPWRRTRAPRSSPTTGPGRTSSTASAST